VDGGYLKGFKTRFTAPDRSEPVPYLVDVSVRPSGVSVGEALQALTNALNAWTAVTSLLFTDEGTTVFTKGRTPTLRRTVAFAFRLGTRSTASRTPVFWG